MLDISLLPPFTLVALKLPEYFLAQWVTSLVNSQKMWGILKCLNMSKSLNICLEETIDLPFLKVKMVRIYPSPFIFSDCMKLLFLSSVHDRFIWSSNWHFLPCTLFFCRKKRTKWEGAKGCNSHVMTNIMLQPKANLPRALHPRWTFLSNLKDTFLLPSQLQWVCLPQNLEFLADYWIKITSILLLDQNNKDKLRRKLFQLGMNTVCCYIQNSVSGRLDIYNWETIFTVSLIQLYFKLIVLLIKYSVDPKLSKIPK